jgi:deoxyhypusine synthase
MNISKMHTLEGIDTNMHPSKSLEEGAGIAYCNPPLGFFEWGGGGPKNWIQTLGPFIKQIYDVEFEGADRGIQITTAPEHDGGLSGCTFGEAVTWGKYKDATKGLVQIRQEYSTIVPLLVGYVMDNCKPREHRRLYEQRGEFREKLLKAAREVMVKRGG